MNSKAPAIQPFIDQLTDPGQQQKLQSLLPKEIPVSRFVTTVNQMLLSSDQLDSLLRADRNSLLNACIQAASDGLMLDGKHATLVPFKQKVIYLPMVQGLVRLARQSPNISNVFAEMVYRNDAFSYRPGIDKQPQLSPDWFGDRGEPVGAYATVVLVDGECLNSVMTRERIMTIARSGYNLKQYQPDTGAHYVEWWKKAALRNVLKYAPVSSTASQALTAENVLYKEHQPGEPVLASPVQHVLEQTRIRTVSEQPSGRSMSDCPDSESVTATKTSYKKNSQEGGKPTQNQTNVQPVDSDCVPIKQAIEIIDACFTMEQLQEAGQAMKGRLRADDEVAIREAYRIKQDLLMSED